MMKTNSTHRSVSDSDQYGTRYATLGFLTSGKARTADGYGPHPYETFSYDSALLNAKIQDFNIVPYSSVLPASLKLLTLDSVEKSFFHGAVLEVILAEIGITYSTGPARRNIGIRTHGRVHVIDSDSATMAAASAIAMQTDVKDSDGKVVGGYVTEYVDAFSSYVGEDYAEREAHDQLNKAMDHLLTIRGFDPGSGNRQLSGISYIEATEQEPHAYTLNGMGFLNFKHRSAVKTSNP